MICPVCGDELSPITKVCPRCGAVVDNDTLSDDLKDIELDILNMKSCPPITFGTYFSAHSYILYALITIVFLIVTVLTQAGLFLILSIITAFLTIYGIIRKFTTRRALSNSEKEFNDIKNNVETSIRIIRQDYGESREIKNKLKEYQDEIDRLSYDHDVNKRRAIKVWAIVLVIVVIVSIAGIVLLGSRDLAA